MKRLTMSKLPVVLLVLALGFLTGCNLQADTPLLDPKDGRTPLGTTFSVMGLNAAGDYEIDKKGNPGLASFRQSGDGVFAGVGPTGETMRLTFHAIAGQPDLHLLQLYHSQSTRVGYAIGRKFGEHYAVDALNPDSATIAAAKQNGAVITSAGLAKKVKTRTDLLAQTSPTIVAEGRFGRGLR
ncbi:MAG TPA: hypothetical protein VMX97_13350, partial [Hyphomicrobiaceae bacterium]|nr:hypothetical protein [Hyphomicrobiaceae bacterium]